MIVVKKERGGLPGVSGDVQATPRYYDRNLSRLHEQGGSRVQDDDAIVFVRQNVIEYEFLYDGGMHDGN